jgi:PAP2 superfamily.
MTDTRPFEPAFRPRPFAVCHLLALLLLATWVWEPTRLFWDRFDDQIFFLLNGSLESEAWKAFWAVASLRPMDVVTGLVMLLLVIRRDWAFDARSAWQAVFGFCALVLLLLIIREGFAAAVTLLGWQRPSPSLVFEDAVRLSELFPDWEVKDSSNHSFPGDHAAVALLWSLFLSLFVRGHRLLIVWTLAALFMMPRLVAGAHWSSDDFVGGLTVALLTLAWGFYTPFAARVGGWLHRRAQPLLAPMTRQSPFAGPQ